MIGTLLHILINLMDGFFRFFAKHVERNIVIIIAKWFGKLFSQHYQVNDVIFIL